MFPCRIVAAHYPHATITPARQPEGKPAAGAYGARALALWIDWQCDEAGAAARSFHAQQDRVLTRAARPAFTADLTSFEAETALPPTFRITSPC